MSQSQLSDERRGLRLSLFVLFTFSGAAGLMYEAVWSRYLKLFLGHSAFAQTFVIAVFMGGMAIGAYLTGRHATRMKSLLKGYAYAEFGIGAFALVFQPLFEATMAWAYDSALPALGSPTAVTVFKQALAVVLILPPCVLLGMTFPLMSGGVIRLFPNISGSVLSTLYFTNSIGAAAGVLVTGFVLVDIMGLPGTMALAAILNICIGLVVLFIAQRTPETTFTAKQPKASELSAVTNRPMILLGVAALTGLASFVYEIAWIRMLSMLLGSSSHAFELMLATFIAGLAFGGLWIKRRIDHLENPVHFLAGVQWVMGMLAVVTVFIYNHCFDIMAAIMAGLTRTPEGYILFNILSNAVAVLIMFPAAFCAGTTLPLITHSLLKQGYGERSIGMVYSSNTVGSIVGVVLATHVGLPLLGLKGLVCLGAAVDIVAGVALFWLVGTRMRAGLSAAFGGTMLVVALVVVSFNPLSMASGVYRTGWSALGGQSTSLFHRDGKAASVSVVEAGARVRTISTNGKADASLQMESKRAPEGDEVTQTLLGLLPMAVKPDAQTAAVVGFGSGMSTTMLLHSPNLKQVDTIEIEATMVEGARLFSPHNDAAYNDPRSRIIIDDARSFLASHNARYDIIISEPSNPWVSGVASLFSTEFYSHINRHLADGGILVQWVQLYELDIRSLASIMGALETHFSDYTLFASDNHDLVIVARNGQAIGPLSELPFKQAGSRHELGRFLINHLNILELERVGNGTAMGPFWKTLEMAPNSDYFPGLDSRAARSRFLRASSSKLLQLADYPVPILDLLGRTQPHSRDWLSMTPVDPQSNQFTDVMRVKNGHIALWTARAIMGHTDALGIKPAADVTAAITALRAQPGECGQPEDEARLLSHMGAINGSLTPYLDSRGLAKVWRAVQGHPCFEEWSTRTKLWLEFYAATGSRDARRLGVASYALFEAQAVQRGAPGQWVFAAALASAVAEGKIAHARQVFAAHRIRLLGNKGLPLPIRVILAHMVTP